MSEMFYQGLDRRKFIKTSLGSLGALVTLGVGGRQIYAKKNDSATRWAFMADTHIPAVEESFQDPRLQYYAPSGHLRKAISQISTSKAQGTIICGDLARLEGKQGDYESMKKILDPLALQQPIFLGLGNHDNRKNFYRVFPTTEGEKQNVHDKHVVVIDTSNVRLIILDSLFRTNLIPGLLGKAQRDWLFNYLKSCDQKPIILCFHHTLDDSDNALLDVPRLYKLIGHRRQVKALVFGHSHRYVCSQWEGIHLINLPAVGYSFNKNEPVGWVEASFTAGSGEFTYHTIDGDPNKYNKSVTLEWRR